MGGKIGFPVLGMNRPTANGKFCLRQQGEPTVGNVTAEWEQLPPDPDLVDDLGYEMLDLEVLPTEDGSTQYMFIPRDEDMIREDAFLVAGESAICDPRDHV